MTISTAVCKLLSDRFTLQQMFVVLAVGSVVVHVRTIFFMPYNAVPENVEKFSLFRSSVAGQLFCRTKVDEKKTKDLSPVTVTSETKISKSDSAGMSFKECLQSPLFWQFLVSYNILSVRVKSIQGIIFQLVWPVSSSNL